MRGKKYKPKDKTVQKSGRDGLVEINLHSRESVSISSREGEHAVRKAPDSVHYLGKHRAVPEKKKRRRRASVPENKSGADRSGDGHDNVIQPEMSGGRHDIFMQLGMSGGRHDNFKQPETTGNVPGFEASGTGSSIRNRTEPESPQTETVPGAAGKLSEDAETPDARGAVPVMTDDGAETGRRGNGMSASGVCRDSHGSPAGMAAGSLKKRQRATGRTELKYDTARLDSDGSAACLENEKAACVQEEAPENGMDTQNADGRLFYERGHASVQTGRSGSIQQTVFRPAGSENSRRQTDRKRKKRRKRNKKLYQKNRRDIYAGEGRAGADGKEESAAGGGSAAADMHVCGGAPDRQDADSGSTAGYGSPPAGHGRKTLPERRQRLLFSSDEKAGMETAGSRDLKDSGNKRNGQAGSRNPLAAAGNGTLKDTGSRKRPDAKETAPPDGSEKGSRKHGRQERDGSRKSGRLIFGEKDSGMVRGSGMGIAKQAVRSAFHAVDESGGVGTDGGDEPETGPERLYRNRRAGAAASGLRHMMRSRSSRTEKCRQRTDEYSPGLQHEKAGKTSGTGTGRQPGMSGESVKNGESTSREKKKNARRMQQKKRYKRTYQSEVRAGVRKAGRPAAGAAYPGGAGDVRQTAGRKQRTAFSFFKRKETARWIFAAVFLLFLAGVSMLASCTALVQGTSGIAGTAYPGSDEDIRSTEARYLELENALDSQVNSMEDAHPGYDEYRYQIDEISHDPYQLASYLTVVCPGYTYAQAEGMLQEILESQYRLTVEEQTEIRTDPDTGEIMEWRVLCISLTNRGLDAVAHDRLTEDQKKLYHAYNLTHGCRDGLFGETEENSGPAAGVPDDGLPAVPGGALSGQRFSNMLREAEKYLSYPYVWGGSSPQTSFDCSGFVSWVVNHCGNGWNVGRQTAEGLRGCCSYVAPEDAQPGDLIFFQGTYNTPGASHVGIYIGSNRMIHCGSPVQITELGNYWQLHFLSYGRLP